MSPSVSKAAVRRLEDSVLGVFKDVPTSSHLDHLVRCLSSWNGCDKFFMIAQYGTQILAPILHLRAKAQYKAGLRDKPSSLAAIKCEDFGKLVGDSRMLWRMTGLFPVIQWAISLEKRQYPTRRLLTIERLQVWSLIAYYPLEHIYYLGHHEIIKIRSDMLDKLAIWSSRFWALYVVLQFMHILEDRKLLFQREKALKGVELNEKESKEIVQRRRALTRETWMNLGYLPLTIHWSLKEGLYSDEIWTGFFGMVAALVGFHTHWISCV